MADTSALIEELEESAGRASQSWRPGARVVSVEPLTGGTSSLTFTVRLEGVPEADEVVVLKVAPPGLPPVRNRDVLRQGTVMRALAGREGVVVPEVLFEDAGDPPGISPFLAMNLVPASASSPYSSPIRTPGASASSAPGPSTQPGCSPPCTAWSQLPSAWRRSRW